ncbi:SRPBCC domain-containing protein [Paenibacillus arenilitoris]
MASQMITKVDGNVITLERVFDAPRELVFKVFSDAEHLKKWWGPRGWEVTVSNMDFRPGGFWHYCMKCVDKNQGDFFGYESWGKSVYQEIDQPNQIVYTDYFSDAEGTESDEMPATEVTMSFIEEDGKTKIVNRGVYVSEEALKSVIEMGMEQGIAETWDRLGEYLQAQQQ